MARIHINFLRLSDLPAGHTADKVLKILWLGNDTAQVKSSNNGQIRVFNLDFSNAPVTTDSQETPNGYSDIVYRYHKTTEMLNLWIACFVPDNTGIPNPDYEERMYDARTSIFLATGETNDVETPSGASPSWIPTALTELQKKERVISKIKKWREQVKRWLFEAPTYAALVPDILTHLGYWLKAADYTIKLLWDEKVAGTTTYDWSVLEAVIDEAIKGPSTLDPDGDGAYNVEFFMNLKTAISSFPTGPTFGVIWVDWWALTETSTADDVSRVPNMVTSILIHSDMANRIKGNIPTDYNPLTEYWS
ncbi:MAG: hypothetical protein F4118_12400 [Acidimicrobiaceae bacterium]|nr:hypothetical protein [Candidatus Poribacteria bacterium]MYI37204.1 hypothetical protein [Acidimicrobiaceae bacterium]